MSSPALLASSVSQPLETPESPWWSKAWFIKLAKKIGKKLAEQWFIFGMVGTILLAYLFPEPGRKGGFLHPEITVTFLSIILVFFLTGISLKVSALKNSLLSWKHQLLTLVLIFGVNSAVTFGLVKLMEHFHLMNSFLLEGLLVLSTVPSTISSCTILTQAAGGNSELSVINSITSNSLGVFISPGLIFLYMGKSSSIDIGKVFFQLGVTVVIPLVVGVTLQLAPYSKKCVAWTLPRLKLNLINQITLLFVIYCTFCETFSKEFNLPIGELWAIFGVVAALHFIFLAIAWLAYWPKFLGFSWEDRIAGLFNASQKTLAVGIPLIAVLYADNSDPNAGLAAIPILIFHPFQLVVASLVAPKLRNKKPAYQQLQNQTTEMEFQLRSHNINLDIDDEEEEEEELEGHHEPNGRRRLPEEGEGNDKGVGEEGEALKFQEGDV